MYNYSLVNCQKYLDSLPQRHFNSHLGVLGIVRLIVKLLKTPVGNISAGELIVAAAWGVGWTWAY